MVNLQRTVPRSKFNSVGSPECSVSRFHSHDRSTLKNEAPRRNDSLRVRACASRFLAAAKVRPKSLCILVPKQSAVRTARSKFFYANSARNIEPSQELGQLARLKVLGEYPCSARKYSLERKYRVYLYARAYRVTNISTLNGCSSLSRLCPAFLSR